MTNLNSTNPHYIRYRDSLTTVCWWPISTIQILTTSGTETTLLLYAECWWVITHINSLNREQFTLVMNHFVLSVLTLWGGGGEGLAPPSLCTPLAKSVVSLNQLAKKTIIWNNVLHLKHIKTQNRPKYSIVTFVRGFETNSSSEEKRDSACFKKCTNKYAGSFY